MGITGVVLTRADGDSRGAALIRHVTGCPIKLVLVKNRMRWKNLILNAWPAVFSAWAMLSALLKKQRKQLRPMKLIVWPAAWPGQFDMNDFLTLRQLKKMGGMAG